MGCNVEFIAFRHAPDLAKLAAIERLEGYRLFKHISRDEWYLEGPNPEGGEITFFEPLDYVPKSPASKHGKANAKALWAAIKGLKAYGFDEARVAAALTLSIELGIPTLLIYSNDDGVDAGFICNQGQIEYAKLSDIDRRMVIFEANGARVEPAQAEEFEDDGPVLDMHQFATEAANTFFGTSIRWRVTSDPYEFAASDYTLLAQSGQRAPFRLPNADTKDALHAIERIAGESEKRAAFIAIGEPHLVTALDPAFINADRTIRDLVEWQLAACFLYANNRKHSDATYAAFSEYLDAVLTYVRLLRPSPDFRREMDFVGEARQLSERWRTLRAKHVA